MSSVSTNVQPKMTLVIPIPPGTEFFGIAYSDCSAGGWRRDHGDVLNSMEAARDIGLKPMFVVRAQMKSETLEERL